MTANTRKSAQQGNTYARTAAANRTLPIFFLLAYLLSWLVWGTSLAEGRGQIAFHIPGPFAFISLSIAAVVMAIVSGGRAALRDLLERWIRWRAHPFWYLVALLLPSVLGLATIAVATLLGKSHTIGADATFGASLVYFATHVALFLATEETAWRGFALPRLQARYTALSASVLLGLVWGLWHMPLFFTPGSFQSTIPFFGFILSAVATSILHTWIFNHTTGSVLIAAIFHAAIDASIVWLGVMTDGPLLFWAFVVLQWVAALAVIFTCGPLHLTRKHDLAGTAYPL